MCSDFFINDDLLTKVTEAHPLKKNILPSLLICLQAGINRLFRRYKFSCPAYQAISAVADSLLWNKHQDNFLGKNRI
jgi:hypothetical protein